MSYICVGASLAQPSGIDRYQPSRGVRRTVRIASAGTLTVEDCVRIPRIHSAAQTCRGRDGTTYSRFHPTNYLSHHLAGIVTAAVFADAAHIVEEIVLLKTRVTAAAAADPTE